MPAVSVSASAPDHAQARVWSTDQVGPAQRLDYWVGAICEAFLEMDCDSRQAHAFEGELRHLALDSVAVNRVSASTQDVYRTNAAIARSRDSHFYLIAQLDRPWHVRQGRDLQHLRPGDAILVDAARPYELHFPAGVHCVSVQMPRAWVGRWLGTLESSHARVAHRDTGWGAVLSQLCLQLGRVPRMARQMSVPLLEDQLGSLLAAAMEPCEWDRLPPSDELHARACAWLKEHLSDPGLRVDDLSQALGVPLRSLQRLFALRGATVTATLKALRMQQAQAMLSQARLRHLPMGEVAQRCGYSAPSHFGRDFLRAVGISPARWRAQRLR